MDAPDALHSDLSADATMRRSARSNGAWIACLALAPVVSIAAPTVFEETAKITSPDPTYTFLPSRVAVDGDTIIATGVRYEDAGESERHAVFMFQRQSNGDWAYVSTLAENSCRSGEQGEDTCNASVAMRNGLAVVAAGQVHVLERSSNGSWVAAPTDAYSGPGEAAVGSGAVVTSESNGCAWAAQVLRKNSTGVWTPAATIPGPSFPCDPWGLIGSDVDMSVGNYLIVGNSAFVDGAHIYEPTSTTWTQAASLSSPVNGASFGGRVTIGDERAFVTGGYAPIHVFGRGTGAWTHSGDIVPVDGARRGPAELMVRDLLIAGFPVDPHRGGSVSVFEETSLGEYQEVAKLVASDSTSQSPQFLGQEVAAHVDDSFARIVASSSSGLYVFDLDTWGVTPAPLQEHFEQGNAANWTPIAGSSFSVVTSGGSKVYRQASLAGDAASHVTSIDWTDQAIEADIKPTAFNGTNRWIGLAVRRTDENNYYYAALRQSNMLELKRMVNGAYVTLASTTVPVALNRNYRLRLEAVGTLLRVYVDGRLALEAYDTALTHGHAGVRMYKASADFDTLILSHNPQLVLLDHRTNSVLGRGWSLGPGAWSFDYIDEQLRLVQEDTSGDALAIAPIGAEDQIVQARAFVTSFAGGTGSRWFGLTARYIDDQNHYYVTVRRDNTISLRKLVNGAIHVLDSAPFTVSPSTWYDLRLEAIGTSLRAYVNGNLVLEASDTSYASGRYGVALYKTAAFYDDFYAWEP